MKTLFASLASKLYDRNSVSYKLLREFYHCRGKTQTKRIEEGSNREDGWDNSKSILNDLGEKTVKALKCVAVIPLIPVWNHMARMESDYLYRHTVSR